MKTKALAVIILCFLSTFYGQAQDSVVFSISGGFYDNVFALQLDCQNPQNHIRYTTNGNRPTAQSPRYENALTLDEHLYSKSDIYTVVNCPETEFYLPDSVQHCIVIRAAVFDENDSCVSKVITQSYFIRALGCDTHGLPVVSLCADSLALFDYETGIFVPGVYYDPLDPNWTGNYYEEGWEWERPMNIEFYEQDNTGINQQAGIRTHGGNGRRFQQKCVKIYAREEYGKKRFKHKFFETIPQNNFKHLILKPFAASWNQSGVNDHICNQIASRLNVESLASRPVVLYLNGEYWGIYYIHERPDERYLEDHFGIDIEHVNIINAWNPYVACGTVEHFLELFHWMEDADLNDPEAYAYAATKIDIENFIDYQILELFAENTDWPANNMRCWQLDDGKWRWIFYDGDACLRWVTFTAFENAIYDGPGPWPSNWKATLFFRRLLENPEFTMQFSDRFHELIATTFDYSITGPIFENIRTALEPEIPFQTHRFNYPTSVDDWTLGMNRVKWFLYKRPERILEPLSDFLYLHEPSQVVCSCYPNPFSGELHVSIAADTFEADEIAIYDMMGRKVYSHPCVVAESATEITLHPHLTPGVYLLKVGPLTQKIVRQ